MTDNEIIKAMQCVMGNDVSCSECEYQKVLPFPSCRNMCAKNALGLINRQKAEIERLKKNIDGLNIFTTDYIKVIRLQVMKEFVEEFKRKATVVHKTHSGKYWYEIDDDEIDNILKEMMEVELNKRKEDESNDN